MVRCLRNKILRPELYKYFYSDQTINNALLCLPLVLGYLENGWIDVWVGVIGCGVLFGVGYWVGRRKEIIDIDIGDGNIDGDGRVGDR